MQQQKPALVSANDLVVRKMDNSFKKAACRIEDRHVDLICERVRKILLQAQCVGKFSVGFLSNRREAELVEGEIKFKTVSTERRWLTFLVQPTNTNSRAEFWLTIPDTMDGKNFLDMVKEAHLAVEPEGIPCVRERRKFVITENSEGGTSPETPTSVMRLPTRDGGDSDNEIEHIDTEHVRKSLKESSFDSLERRIGVLSKRSTKIKEAQARKDAIFKRREEIQQMLDKAAIEDQELQEELVRLEADMPNLDAINQTLQTLEALLEK